MKDSNLKLLRKAYPKILGKLDKIWCEDGWYDVIFALCKECSIKFPRIQFVEVKEKFGRLIAIPKHGTYPEIRKEELWELLESYSDLSTTVCEETGGMGKLRSNQHKSMKTLCDSSAVLLGYDTTL